MPEICLKSINNWDTSTRMTLITQLRSFWVTFKRMQDFGLMGQPISDNQESTRKFFSSTEGVWKEHDIIMNSMINAECTISAQLFPSALMT